MKIGIVLQSNKLEHVWNTFRFANTALKTGHSVQMVLMSEGVEAEDLMDTPEFDISKKIEEFKNLAGVLLACESCLNIRSKNGSKICPVTTMVDLLKIVEESDKTLVFG
ncbi:MAG: DsrE family protein [Patescibacteria group bacterium]